MNRYLTIAGSCAAVALIGWAAASLSAQQYPAGGGRATPPATPGGRAAQPAHQPPPQPARPAAPAAPARGGRRGGGAPAMEGTQQEAGRATNIGTNTPGAPAPVPMTVTNIGTVHIAKAVKADGKDLK